MDTWGNCFRLIMDPVSGLAFQVADVIFCNEHSLDLQKTLVRFSLQYLNVDSRAFRRVRIKATSEY